MSDLTERMRELAQVESFRYETGRRLIEAADEIERLTALLEIRRQEDYQAILQNDAVIDLTAQLVRDRAWGIEQRAGWKNVAHWTTSDDEWQGDHPAPWEQQS